MEDEPEQDALFYLEGPDEDGACGYVPPTCPANGATTWGRP